MRATANSGMSPGRPPTNASAPSPRSTLGRGSCARRSRPGGRRRRRRRPCGSGSVADDLEQRRQPGVVAHVDLVPEPGQALARLQPPGDGGGRADLLALDEQLVDLRRRRRRGAALGPSPSPAANAGYGPVHVEPATRTASVLVASSWSASRTSARSSAGPNGGRGIGAPDRRQARRPAPAPGAARSPAPSTAGTTPSRRRAAAGGIVAGVVHAEGAGHGDQRRHARPPPTARVTRRARRDVAPARAPATSRRPGRAPVHSSSATCSNVPCGPARRRRGRGSGRRPRRAS